MRDEDEVQDLADRVASTLNNGKLDRLDLTTLIATNGTAYEAERLRGMIDALDWVLGDGDWPL